MEELSGGHRHGPVGGVHQVVHVLAVLVGQSVLTPPGRTNRTLMFNVRMISSEPRKQNFLTYIATKTFVTMISLYCLAYFVLFMLQSWSLLLNLIPQGWIFIGRDNLHSTHCRIRVTNRMASEATSYSLSRVIDTMRSCRKTGVLESVCVCSDCHASLCSAPLISL